MKRYKQFDSLIIDDFEVEEWPHPRHNHNHYEFIFIEHGKGIHHFNEQQIPYAGGELFLLGPDDEHEFCLETSTRFIYFKFNLPYLLENDSKYTPSNWYLVIDHLLNHPTRKRGNLITQPEDKSQLRHLTEIILNEHRLANSQSGKVIFQLFTVMILIVYRNLQLKNSYFSIKENSLVEKVLGYIAMHIYEPRKLTLKQLSVVFHYSPNYLSSLFRREMGQSLKMYISDFRFRLISERMRYGTVPQKQLVAEFGFVDESHLHKFIRSKSGKRIGELG